MLLIPFSQFFLSIIFFTLGLRSMYCSMPSVLHIFVPESKLLLTLFIYSTPPHDCLRFHDFTYYAVAVLVVVMAVIVYFPFLTFCSTNRTCFLTTKEQTFPRSMQFLTHAFVLSLRKGLQKGSIIKVINHTHIHTYT